MIAACALAFAAGCSGNKANSGTDATATATVQAQPAKNMNYKCPECGYGSMTAGDCPKDKISLVKVGNYYCPECYMSDSLPGKCKMCGVEMKKME
jgi:uncharacterized Zn finger protein (UPF0148 family)